MNVRTWPALDVGRLTLPPANGPDLLQAALVDYRISAVDETTPDEWQIFFSTSAERDRAAENLTLQFPDLSIRPLDVPDEDWAAKSQANLRAVRIGNIIVAPPWDIPDLDRPRTLKRALYKDPRSAQARTLKRALYRHPCSAQAFACATPDPATGLGVEQPEQPIVIVIRPSMGFGTAHHPTTRLCLAALQRLDVRGRSAVDVGTGSGVLAIAASRLGAAPVVGIDDDLDALHSAEEDLSLNRDAAVTLRAADLRSTGPFDAARGGPEAFDLVMANLTGALLTEAAGRLRDLAAPGGRLILCGFMRHEETTVLAAYSDLFVCHRSEEEEWVCVGLRRS